MPLTRPYSRGLGSGGSDAVLAACLVTDVHGKIRHASLAAAEMLGGSTVSLTAKSLLTFMGRTGRKALASRLARLKEEGGGLAWEGIIKSRGKAPFPASISVAATQDDNNVEGWLHWLLLDISPRRLAQQQLVVEHAAARALGESVTLAEAFPRMCESLDWELAELWLAREDAPMMDCVHRWSSTDGPHERTAAPELPGRVWASGQPEWISDLRSTDLDAASHGDRFRSSLVVPVDSGMGRSGALALFSRQRRGPISALLQTFASIGQQLGRFIDRRRAEQALEDSNRQLKETLAELSRTQQSVIQTERLRALGQMASGIAHGIANDLSAITLFAAISLRSEGLEPALRHNLDNITLATVDASNTLNRLRDFYRSRASREVLEPVDLNALVRDVLLLTQTKWKEESKAKGIHIDVVTNLATTHQVSGHPSELREALTNLVFNAVDAMPYGGQLILRTWDEPGSVFLSVADTGEGMDEDTRCHVFEPFFSMKGSQGTGLGLSVCWGVVQRHGGDIGVESQPGKGTVFYLRLPTAGEESRIEKKTPIALRSRRILCIDDEPLVREGLRTLLTVLGHVVDVASDGVEGVETFFKGDFDVVITDLGMPRLNGNEVCRAIRDRSEQTPIILLTGWTERFPQAESPAFDFVLTKPPTEEALLEALSAVLPDR